MNIFAIQEGRPGQPTLVKCEQMLSGGPVNRPGRTPVQRQARSLYLAEDRELRTLVGVIQHKNGTQYTGLLLLLTAIAMPLIRSSDVAGVASTTSLALAGPTESYPVRSVNAPYTPGVESLPASERAIFWFGQNK